jgi:uncharacterized Zn finger protein
MSNMSQPVQVTCTFCGWKKVVRPRNPLMTHKCEQCGCDHLQQQLVSVTLELVSWIKGLFTR